MAIPILISNKIHPAPRIYFTMDARAISAKVLAAVLNKNQHLDQALIPHINGIPDPRDKGLVQELCYGVMRWYFRLNFIAGRLIDKPLKTRDTDITALILCGLYQLIFLRIPDHAAVAATVEAARTLNKPWAARLINALLRRYLREAEAITEAIELSPEANYAHPGWLIEKIQQQWPEDWQAILNANNQYPPFHLRVNRLKGNREAYLDLLRHSGIHATATGFVDFGICIPTALDIGNLPAFQTGSVTVQDFGAQLAAPLLDLQPGHRVLDACAAPGGKTGHIYECEPHLQELIAVEADLERVNLLRDTKERLGFNAKIIHSDILRTEDWWYGVLFDRILLDVPCSASGVIRRHPDIKYHRTPEHIGKLVMIQRQILESTWPLLKPGGRLLYATCSLLHEENDRQIEQFATQYRDAISHSIDAQWGMATTFGRQTLPGRDEADGFYYAVLIKN